MTRNAAVSRSIFLILAGVAVMSLTGCAAFSRLPGWIPLFGQGKIFNKAPAPDPRMKQFAASIRPVDGSAEASYRLGRYFQDRKKHRFAVDEFAKAIRFNPEYVEAYNALGVSLDCLGEFDRAIAAYEVGIKIRPEADYLHNNLGLACLHSGRLDAAVEAFRKAVALKPETRRYRNNLGLAHVRKGDNDSALAEFRKSGNEDAARRLLAGVQRMEQGLPLRPPDIEVLNGNGVNRLAMAVAARLSQKGLRVTGVGNADHHRHPATIIYYSEGYLQEAYRLAQIFPGYQNVERLQTPGNVIRVVIGADLTSDSQLL